MSEEKKPFGGARIIYKAALVRKDSAQDDGVSGDEIPQPSDYGKGKLLDYYAALTDLNAIHACCLNLKATCTVGLGINVPIGAGAKEEAVRERLDIVNQEGQSFGEVLERVCLDFESTGNGYLEIVRGRGGQVEELYHCPANKVVRRTRGCDTAFYYLSDSGARKPMPTFRDDERDEHSLLHLMKYSGNRHYGLPTWRGAAEDIELDYYAVQYNRNFFINSGIPDMAIVVQGGQFDEDTERVITEFFQTNFKGLSNSHRTLFLPVDNDVTVRFEKLTVDQKSKDASFTALREQCRDNILSAHGVPPRLISVVKGAALGGSGESHGQLKIFKEIVVNPRQELFELKLKPVMAAMGLPAITFERMDTDLLESNSQYYPAMTQAGIMTIEEAREDLGLPVTDENKNKASSTIFRYHLEAGILTTNEVRAHLGLPPIAGGDERVVLRDASDPDEEESLAKSRDMALARILKDFRRQVR